MTLLWFGLVSSWNIGHAGYTAFYSSAARSMSISWRAFFFGTFDPGARITLDKLSGFLVPQALSARLFGFHPWSIALPQVTEGLVTVAVVYIIGARWKGPTVGLLAAVLTSTTPLLASMFGHVMEDGLLTMSLAVAFACFQSALLSGRLAPLLYSAIWVAVGFQAKMMQAWLILPALVVGYVLNGHLPLVRRTMRAALFTVVAVVLSLTWMTAIQLVPARHRPYIDGSTNDNMYSMVFGYNGFNRIFPNMIPGALGDKAGPKPKPKAKPSREKSVTPSAPTPPGNRHDKLLLPAYATQVGWLYPLAVGGVVLEMWPLWVRRRVPPRDKHESFGAALEAAETTSVALAIWLVSAALFLSIARIPHTAYVAAISVQVAGFAAGAIGGAVATFRSHHRGARIALPVLFVTELSWTAIVATTSGVAPRWLESIIGVLGVGVSIWLLAVYVRPPAPRITTVVAAGAIAGMMFTPTLWTASVLSRSDEGSASEAYAGPKPRDLDPATTDSSETTAVASFRGSFHISAPFVIPRDPHLDAAQLSLLHYIETHSSQRRPTVATDLWTAAAPYILAAGVDVLPMGGFSGRIPSPTLAQLQALVSAGALRFVIVNKLPVDTTAAQEATARARGGGVVIDGGGVGDFEGAHVLALRSWIESSCARVPTSSYERNGRMLPDQVLYMCTRTSVQHTRG